MDDEEITKISCKQRLGIVFCPCCYFSNADLTSTDCCVCCQEVQLEETISGPSLTEISSTWIAPNPIPLWFIILRVIITILMVYITIYSFVYWVYKGAAMYWAMYITQWVQLISTSLMIVKCISTFKVNKLMKTNDRSLVKQLTGNEKLWNLYICQSILLQTALPSISMVVFNYFAFVWDSEFFLKSRKSQLNQLQNHGVNCFLIWLDFLLSSERMYYKSCIWSVLLGTLYTIWTIIFETFINMNQSGDPYLYKAYDWSESMQPILYYIASAIIMIAFASMATAIKNIVFICCDVATFKYKIANEEEENSMP